jgi:hypothetical protein
MDEYLIYKIEKYFNNIKIDMQTINDELINFENKETVWDSFEDMIYFNKNEIIHDCNMLEVFLRSLRDKLENE